jgi:hypothetical protein
MVLRVSPALPARQAIQAWKANKVTVVLSKIPALP